MFDQWDQVRKKFDEINERLTEASIDQSVRQKLQKQRSHLSTLLDMHEQLVEVDSGIAEAEANTDPEMQELYAEELVEQTAQREEILKQIDDYLFPPDKLDNRSAFIEIRAGAGGQEAALFVADLLRMYSTYAERKGWNLSMVSSSLTDLKGYKEVVVHIKGKNVYGLLKYDSGVHRVQRVPETESAGRVHTSTVTVAVLPEADEKQDIQISPADLRIDVYRASGAGGQHINTTDSAVRITHIPTGVVVSCQDERSQHKNKAKAMKVLQSRILGAERERQENEMSQQRKELVGTGMRAEKVRTYNYPQNRVTDHQVNLTLKKLEQVMEGDMDEIVE
ncbi:MAG TPA: peptide chain release factor 1, partial [Candidatus Babeliales bacterium]|nr:peptide chain release factor 1 [Candidatus Babeliales bacterium]